MADRVAENERRTHRLPRVFGFELLLRAVHDVSLARDRVDRLKRPHDVQFRHHVRLTRRYRHQVVR